MLFIGREYDDEIFKDPYVAYDKYANSGVVKSDSDGNAVLEFRNLKVIMCLIKANKSSCSL